MTYYRTIPFALLTLSLGACASTPMRYYTLTPPLLGAEASTPTCCKIQIRRVSVPPEMDRADIVTRSGAAQVVVYSNDAWLAPLAEEIRSALGSEINRHLSTVAPLASGPTVRDFSVWVNITRFDAVFAQYIVVTADWRIQASSPPKSTATVCATTIRINVTDGIPALVQGYQQALGQIADQIALNLKNAGDTAPGCNAG
jgi:uncharacterized lipoprotein YmbA